MKPIDGLDLHKSLEQANKAFVKIAEARVIDHIRGMMVKAHNVEMKVLRLRNEADQAEASLAQITDQIARIRAGDWSVLDPIDLGDKAQPQPPKE